MAETRPLIAVCPACDTNIRFNDVPRLGQLLTCPECESNLEVVQLSPLELDWAFTNDDDDEYEDEWYEDEYDEDDDLFDDEPDDEDEEWR